VRARRADERDIVYAPRLPARRILSANLDIGSRLSARWSTSEQSVFAALF
jgi:DNA-binding IclR family transcriptional regulator